MLLKSNHINILVEFENKYASALRAIHTNNLKGPFKRIKHVGQTLSKIVGLNVFNPFEPHNQTCWIMLDGVG